MHICVLLGGGIDSACLIPYYLGRNMRVTAVHFDYGQASKDAEWKAASALCEFYDVPLIKKQLGFNLGKTGDTIHARNALFVIATAGLSDSSIHSIALGLHSGTNYYDSSPEFIETITRILDGYFTGTVEIDVPFIGFSKREIMELASNFLLPLELTFSCDRNNDTPCGNCFSCRDMRLLYEDSDALQKA